MGIEILPPDVNLSDHEFMVVEGNIRFGLDAVKGVGYAAVEAMKRAREEGGPFTSLWDFCERVDCRTVNKKAIEALIKCGAFGSTGATRRGHARRCWSTRRARARRPSSTPRSARARSSTSARRDGGASPFAAPAHPPIPTARVRAPGAAGPARRSRSASSSPTTRSSASARRCGPRPTARCAEVMERKDDEWITIGGMITAAKKIRARSGSTLMFATLDDLEGAVELMVFEKTLATAEAALQLDEIVLVKGRVDHKEGGKSCVLVAERRALRPLRRRDREGARAAAVKAAEPPKPLWLVVDGERLPVTVIEELKRPVRGLPGRVRGRARGPHAATARGG